MGFKELEQQYRGELLNSVIPFWEKHSIDKDYGGYFSCLDREGRVFDTDKFIWLQARQVWLFSMLYNRVEKREQWLNIAKDGAEFLIKYGHDGDLNWYFSVNREGKPLVQPYNIFSYCFAAMAFGQLSQACGSEEYADIALKTFNKILSKQKNPKGIYNKAYPETRPLKNFALPMILCNLSLEIEHLIDNNIISETIDNCIDEVMNTFYDKKSGLILENVNPDGSFSDTFDGRLMNPGHAIEAMWFIMDLSERKNDKLLAQKAVEITLNTLNYGWDDKFGGIFYFMDIKGHPTQQLEWDQKLWWVHLETLISLIKGYKITGNTKCEEWFHKVHNYTWDKFSDPEFGEWFGYLNRQGDVLLNLKGGKWKGCFHVPRGLYQVSEVLKDIS